MSTERSVEKEMKMMNQGLSNSPIRSCLAAAAILCLTVFGVKAGDIPTHEIKLTGDLLIMPLVDRKDCEQKPIPGKIKIYVDDKLAGKIEGQLEPFPAGYGLRPRGTVPTMIEIFNPNKLLTRVISKGPLPDLSALTSTKEMRVRFDVYSGKDALMHRITGRMKAVDFAARRDATRASHKPNNSVVSIQVNTKHPVDPEPVKIGLTGTLELEEISELPDAAKKHADMATFDVLVDGQLVHRIHGPHPRNPADAKWWGFLDMKEYKGKTAVLKMIPRGGMTPEIATQILIRFESSDTMKHVNPVYRESGRPQFHFSQIQGWNNDPNGMFCSDGLWHISWQCNPLDKGFGGWYWGHAVSRDLIHWQEAPRALRSHGGEDENRYPGMADANCFSGSACVDINNTLGVQNADQKTIIAAFTDSPHGESLAYSTDGGFRYNVMHDINNIIVHPIPEGAKGRGSWGRDPKLFWHEPTKKWVIVTYRMAKVPGSCSGYMVFYSSSDLKTWKEESITEKLFSNDPTAKKRSGSPLEKDWHECPEFVELPVLDEKGNPPPPRLRRTRWLLMDASPKYQVGMFDGKTFTPDSKEYRWGIFGNMKAAQAFSNGPDGRAVLMIWARGINFGADAPFNSGFTLPLELSLRTADDGIRMYANPVKELEVLRRGRSLLHSRQQATRFQSDTREQPRLGDRA